MPDLKPCPFCGENVVLLEDGSDLFGWFSILCKKCDLDMQSKATSDSLNEKTKNKLIEKWNKRHG